MKKTYKESNGTSFHGTTLTASFSKLKEILGTPYYDDNGGDDKVNYEWVMETDDGNVFTVYDWKEYRSISDTEQINWHIGGMSKAITEQALKEIEIYNV